VSAVAAAPGRDVSAVLRGVESRYNATRTLQVHFTQTYEAPRQAARTESGELYLRRPGRMRWQYTEPAGKLFISDGKTVWLYTPETRQVERSKVKESDDMRTPLAFLLGKLDFNRDFKRFISKPEGENLWITAEPRSDKAPFTKVEFVVAPDAQIRRVIVAGDGGSTMDFKFDGEKLNPPLQEKLFAFQPPQGTEVVEAAE
jgi:outer membrane lipoprotein carrier protein